MEQQTQQKPQLQKPNFKQNKQRPRKDDDGFDSRIINIRRVSRMYKGGRRMRMSVFVVVGDRKGRVGLGLGKGADVALAQSKAVEKAKRSMITVNMKGSTIPHESLVKERATKVLLKPAAPGTGLIAGATVKAILEVAGVKDILSKILGSTNQINTAHATFNALKGLRAARL
ncbi:MAG: 30S ribosomal protein S5 [Candidatus Doudnabacteria bacterium]|nr:30S ribosomal protein S5 [Candidatus Doudnabacteria bacterium]